MSKRYIRGHTPKPRFRLPVNVLPRLRPGPPRLLCRCEVCHKCHFYTREQLDSDNILCCPTRSITVIF